MAKAAVPKPSKSPAQTRRIMAKLESQHPNADTELHYSNPYELLVATILSAQCTDERVNQVTPTLFKRYPDVQSLAKATTGELEPQIQSTGFFRAKSRSLLGMATECVERHGSEVPKTMAELVELPGVGRKTANVVLGHALGVPGLPVDRHVLRVSNRIGIARSDDPEVVEQQLCAAMPPAEWTRTSDTLILHGRRICKPRPLCEKCAVRDDCDYYRTLMGAAQRKPRQAAKPRARGDRVLQRRSESSTPVEERRQAKPRSGGRGAEVPQRRAESSAPVEERRTAKTRAGGREAGGPQSRAESSTLVEKRRAAKPRGTGRGGGALRQIKK